MAIISGCQPAADTSHRSDSLEERLEASSKNTFGSCLPAVVGFLEEKSYLLATEDCLSLLLSSLTIL